METLVGPGPLAQRQPSVTIATLRRSRQGARRSLAGAHALAPKPLLPHTEFVETKQAEGQNAGTSLSPEQSCDAIYAAVKATVQRGHFSMPLRLQAPIVCRLQTQTPAQADLFCQWPALERVDGTMLRFAADSVEHAVRMLNSLSAMSAMLR